MRKRPILFCGEMVRAILDGRKTQTRRVIKPQPDIKLEDYGNGFAQIAHWKDPSRLSMRMWLNGEGFNDYCPYGQAGDSLWVRESYYQFGHWEPKGELKTKTGRQKWHFVPDDNAILFDPAETYRKGRHHKDPYTPAWHKRLGRFMPRAASRIDLEITGVRVERLQDISEEDAIAEGVEAQIGFAQMTWYRDYGFSGPGWLGFESARQSFQSLWQSVYGTWDANPWLWVIEFKKL